MLLSEATYNHSSTHSHTNGGVNHADSQLVRSGQGSSVELSVSRTPRHSEEEPGTFRLPVDPLYLLLYCSKCNIL